MLTLGLEDGAGAGADGGKEGGCHLIWMISADEIPTVGWHYIGHVII